MLLQWVLLQHTEKGTKKAHISHEVQDFTVVICLEKKRGLAGSMPRTGVWCSVPTHRHMYLTWTELCTSSTATANTLATHPAMPLKQCRLGLGLEELLQQERIFTATICILQHHLSTSHHPLPGSQLFKHSTAIAWIWAATPLVPLWVQEPSFREQLSIITTGRTVGTSLLSQ